MANKITKDGISMLRKVYDVYHWLWKHHMSFLSKFVWKLSYIVFSSSIPPTVILEDGVNFGHTMGIVIHQNCRVGKNTMIYQNVTIGRRNGDLEESPSIGENCIIGAGACILGGVRIGNNVKIGANAVVIEDIPDGCTVVGIPGKIIKRT